MSTTRLQPHLLLLLLPSREVLVDVVRADLFAATVRAKSFLDVIGDSRKQEVVGAVA